MDKENVKHRVSGKVSILAHGNIISDPSPSYCNNSFGPLLHTLTELSSSSCSRIRDFGFSSNLVSEVSVTDMVDFLIGVSDSDYIDLSSTGINIENNQSITGGDAKASNNSQAVAQGGVSFKKKSLLTAAAQAVGTSTATSNTNGNTVSSTVTAINTTRSCVRLVPIAKIQYEGSQMVNISMDWQTKLITCP